MLLIVLCPILLLGCGDSLEEQSSLSGDDSEQLPGVVVGSISPGALATAGLAAGDRIVAWQPLGGGTPGAAADDWRSVDSPFDLRSAEHLFAARGSVQLRVGRDLESGGSVRVLTVPTSQWHVEWEPSHPTRLRDLLHRLRATGEAFSAADELNADEAGLMRVVEEAGGALEELGGTSTAPQASAAVLSWFAASMATALPNRWVSEAANVAFSGLEVRSLALADAADPYTRAWAFEVLSRARMRRGDYERALELLDGARSIWQEIDEPLGEARSLVLLARVQVLRGRPADSEQAAQRAVALLEGAAPETLAHQRALRLLAQAVATRGDRREAARIAEHCIEIAERVAPNGYDHQAGLMLRGIFAWFRQDWEQAETAMLSSLRILQDLDPDHGDVFNALHNLGLIAGARGDLATAESYVWRSTQYSEDDPTRRSQRFSTLGTIAARRRDLPAAERWHRQALELREQATPDSAVLATPLLNLGQVLATLGRNEEARTYLERALDLQRRFLPEAEDPCLSELSLARVERELGELEAAEERVVRCIEVLARLRESAEPTEPEAVAMTLLSSIRRAAGTLDEPVREARTGLAWVRRIRPDTTNHALASWELSEALFAVGNGQEGLDVLLATLEILEAQARRLGGGDEVRLEFRREFSYMYRDAVERLVARGRVDEAFRILQRSQARTFLALLAERGLNEAAQEAVLWERDPESANRLAALGQRRDEIRDSLADVEGTSAERESALRAELDEITTERSALLGADEPALEDVFVMDGSWLPAHTAIVSYSVGETQTVAFVLSRTDGLRHAVLPMGAEKLSDRVDRFRLLLEAVPMESAGAREERGYEVLAREVGDLLFGFLWDELDDVQQLVVVPDDVLHRLPFAALLVPPSPVSEDAAPVFLVERFSLQVAASATVYRALRQASRPPRPAALDGESPRRVIAFADPLGPAPNALERALRTTGDGSEELRSLPNALAEAESIRQTFGSGVELLVGQEASETRTMQLSGYDVVHFATHGIVDEQSPLDSALLLSSGAGEGGFVHNGLLQAWEIFDRVRLDADLVTLSACETGLGKDFAGEGLLSLTRAFQHAGARSVVATLWRVRDDSTARLMARFYEALAGGASRHQALQSAQLSLLRAADRAAGDPLPWWRRLLSGERSQPRGEPARDWRHPYYWAGFQLYGDGG